MRRRVSGTHILIAVAVVLAFALNLLALSSRDATTLVAVASRPLVAGATLTSDDLRLVPVPADMAGMTSLVGESDLGEVTGWVLAGAVAEGALIQRTVLAPPAVGGGLRSMAVPVAVEHAAGGTLAVGDRVDVITVSDGEAHFAVVDVEVVGVADSDSRSFGSTTGYHVVLAVGSDEALRLAEAIESGSLEVIRSTGAGHLERGEGVDDP